MKFGFLILCTAFAASAAVPDFKITPVPGGKHMVFQKIFSQHINVFGVRVFGTAKTPPAKLRHIAIVLAEYLDNDEDGKPDNPAVVAELVKRNAFMGVAETERAMDRLDHRAFERAGFELSNALPAQAKGLADLLEGVLLFAREAVAQSQD